MISKIENGLDELESYINECKSTPMNRQIIKVDKERIEEIIQDLRSNTPPEIRKYQKLLSNYEAIIADAKKKGDAIIREAQINRDDLVSQHVIMQKAHEMADDIVAAATAQAQETIDTATLEVNELYSSASSYTDGILANIEEILTLSIEATRKHNEELISQLSQILDVVISNRKEIVPQEFEEEVGRETAENHSSDGLEFVSGLEVETDEEDEDYEELDEEFDIEDDLEEE